MEETLEKIRGAMRSIKEPTAHSLVYKDECTFSYDTPFALGGVAVSLTTWQGYGEQYVGLDHERTGNVLYLLQKWKDVPKTEEEIEAGKAATVAGQLVIGATTTKVEKEHALLIMPDNIQVPLPNQDIPTIVSNVCQAIIGHSGVALKDNVAAFVEDFEAKESKYARSLEQLPSESKKISPNPKDWKCEESGVTENLWLNLATGNIGSGRKHWDGSGGNGAAERHFEATGKKYPLVVKLGTITPEGADIFSYAADENDMVLDPLLADHLAHWGIDVMKMAKTEKTMAELQVTLNMEHDFSAITEDGQNTKPLAGPGFVGIANLGNSCYLNSVVQCLFATPEVKARYFDPAADLFKNAPESVAGDFVTQMAKLGVGLLSDRYAHVPEDKGDGPAEMGDMCVRPLSFRTLVGKGHPEFSTARQQDAAEYLEHLLEVMMRAERAAEGRISAGPPIRHYFESTFEERLQCVESGQVKYKSSKHLVTGLNIPVEAATNTAEVKEFQDRKRAKTTDSDTDLPAVIPDVPFAACLEQLFTDEIVPDVYSSALKRNALFKKSNRFATFPKYLALKLNRYYVADNWEPKKMDVKVMMPDELDLEQYRAKGLQEGETELLEGEAPAADAAAAATPAVELNMEMVEQLKMMGFSENGCKRAVRAAGSSGVEAASEWIFAHMEDSDFNDPMPEIVAPGAEPAAAADASAISEDAIAMLTPLGFSHEQAEAALISTKGNSERAADWLFSHMDNLDAAVAEVKGAAAAAAAGPAMPDAVVTASDDGPGKYTLFGIVSHLGKNTGSGHYVAHVKKDGKWVLYNDRKVAESSGPPLDVGYMYIYQRNE